MNRLMVVGQSPAMANAPPTDALQSRLEATARALRDAHLGVFGATQNDHERQDLLSSIEDFLLPRLSDAEAPAVASIVGLSGTGKSTILNSLAQQKLSPPGAVRPTTSAPVMWAHRRHAGRYWSEFVSAVRERVGPSVELVLGDAPLVSSLTIIDTPPFDVGLGAGAEITRAVLKISDLCVFVASASRYADAAALDLMKQVRARGLPMLFVLNRLSSATETSDAVANSYAQQLAAEGLIAEPDPSLLFTSYEQGVIGTIGGLPRAAVAGLHQELGELADPSFRQQLLDQARHGVLAELAVASSHLAGPVAEEEAKTRQLVKGVEVIYQRHLDALGESVRRGDFAGEIEGWPDSASDLAHAATRRAGTAAQEAASGWSEDPQVRPLLEGEALGLWRHGLGTYAIAEELVLEWGEDLLGRLAVERSKRGRLSNRKRKRFGKDLMAGALSRDGSPPSSKLMRAFGSDGSIGMVRTARGMLQNAFAETFALDQARFAASLTDLEALAVLRQQLIENAPAFADAAVR